MIKPKVTLEFDPYDVHRMSGWAPLNAHDTPTPEIIMLADDAISRTIYVVETKSEYDFMTGNNVERTKVSVISIAPRSKAQIRVDWQPEPDVAELPF